MITEEEKGDFFSRSPPTAEEGAQSGLGKSMQAMHTAEGVTMDISVEIEYRTT